MRTTKRIEDVTHEYRYGRDEPQALGLLLVYALAARTPVAITRVVDDETGEHRLTEHIAGQGTWINEEQVIVDRHCGEAITLPRWQIARARLIEEGWEAA